MHPKTEAALGTWQLKWEYEIIWNGGELLPPRDEQPGPIKGLMQEQSFDLDFEIRRGSKRRTA